jgi:uncharacterized protein (TIGR02147 family)
MIYKFEDYKEYVRERVRAMPHRGKGQFKRIAEELGVHTSLLSQVFNGPRDLSLEQACLLAAYFGLDESEREYFVLLVQLARAGNEALRALTREQLARLRVPGSARKEQGGEEATPGSDKLGLTEAERLVFHSTWYYTAIWQVTALPGRWTIDAVSDRLGLPANLIRQVLEFLVSAGLCTYKAGAYSIGLKREVLYNDSPHAQRILLNWRLRAIERLPRETSRDLFYNFVASMPRDAIPEVRELLRETIRKFEKHTEGKEETLACLNIDWFEF